MSSEIKRLRMALERLERLEIENERLCEREMRSVELIKELISNALAATFKASEAAMLLKSASQSMTNASAQACLLSWELQNEESLTPALMASPAALPAPGTRLTLVKSNTG